MQRIYAHRRRVLIATIDRDLSRWLRSIPSAAGLHVAATLKFRASDRAIEAAALRQGVGVRALSAFSARRASPSGLAFGYGDIEEPQIVEALAVLRRVLSSESLRA